MHISKIYNLPITGHNDIEFVDIDERRDVKLFIDPYVIEALSDEFCIEANKVISTFFKEVFDACQAKQYDYLSELLEYASEPNETNFGMKRISQYGKGATAKELMKLFDRFYQDTIENGISGTNPLTPCMYMQGFDKDHLSDLVTNVIRKQLYDFTVKQCKKWNIKMSAETEFLGYYWDADDLQWKELYGRALHIGTGRNLLLVPKHIVRRRYVFSIETYIQQYILKERQEWHLTNYTDLCTERELANGSSKLYPPTRKELKSIELRGKNLKRFANGYSKESPETEQWFINDILKRIRDGYGFLGDDELDIIVYIDNDITGKLAV